MVITMNENVVETYLRKKAKENDCLCYKFITGGSMSGVPDRVIIGHGKTVFVETKAPGKIPRKLQQYVIRIMREHGATVYVADTKEKIDNLISDITHIS